MTAHEERSAVGRLRYIVLDTNAFGSGKIRLEQVEGLASDLATAGVVVLVPEVVLWEWAQHAHEDLDAFYTQQASMHRVLRGAQIPGHFPDVPNGLHGESVAVDRILEHLTERLAALANVRILPTAPSAALVGLKAQILQQGSGRRKSGTKTGAADMAWVHSALEHVGGDPTRLAFLSGDGDIDRACVHLGIEQPRRFTNRNQAVVEIRQLVQTDPTTVARALARHVCRDLPAPVKALTDKLTDLVSIVDEESVRTVLPDSWRTTGASVREITGLAAVEDVRVEGRDSAVDASLVTGTLQLVGTLSALLWEGGHNEGTPWNFRDVAMRVPVTAHFDGHQISGLRAAGPAQLEPTASRFYTVDEAKASLAEALGRAPGLDRVPWIDLFNGERPDELGDRLPDGLDVLLDFPDDDDEQWTAQFVVRGRPHDVLILENSYAAARMKHAPFEIETPADPIHGPAKPLDGPVAATAYLVSLLVAAGSL
ncbi:hypothetical protein ACFT2C_05205 [Promicromonospora sp. NPDC057138]|uniref:hypothetical protein n=1 Tax=Promicromonospora sp. NPDC057138 TaxID=3346031 RepID=UPI003627CF77